MTTEATATILIGPMDIRWGATVFQPSHTLVLREGSRPWWTSFPASVGTPMDPVLIKPETPRHLLATGLLGHLSLVAPGLLDVDSRLPAAVRREGAELIVDPLDDDVADAALAVYERFCTGVATILDGCSVSSEEIQHARCRHLEVLVSAVVTARRV